MSVLTIDIGNSRIGFNVYTAGKAKDEAVRLTRAQLDDDLASTLKSLWDKAEREAAAGDKEAAIVISSVVPALTEQVERAALRQLNRDARLVGRDLKVPLKTMLRDETTVGQDRLLGALAAYVNVEAACAIVHAGSALVVDCIDDEGVFRGGAIAPGLQMSARALHAFAAQLPEVSLTPPATKSTSGGGGGESAASDPPFGRYTQEAINLGLFVGGRGAVRELVERYATALGAWPHVVATGGDAQALLGEADMVDSFVPDLVLQGAALAWEKSRGT